jgi:hypothetical protein
MKAPRSGGGWKAIAYTLRMANRVGWWKLWTAMRSKNACKTCALGMGGQMGGHGQSNEMISPLNRILFDDNTPMLQISRRG